MDHAQEDEYECTLIHEVSQDTEYPFVFPVDVILHAAAHQGVSRERAGRVQVGCGGGDCVSVCARVRVGESGTWCSCAARGERHRLS